jgi:formate hydrogenlyase subunit 4
MIAASIALLGQLIHTMLILLAAPLVAGVSGWLQAHLTGRAAPPILEPVWDLVRLSRKTQVVPENASFVLPFASAVSLAATLSAASLVPSFTLGMALSPLADGLVVAGLLSIGRIAACLGALDVGSAPSGSAAERGSAIAVLAEPAMVLLVFSLALMAGGFNLDQIVSQQREGLLAPAAASAASLLCLLALAYADMSSRTTELEGDLSGIDLAVSRYGGWLRRVVWINLIGALFLPIGMAGVAFGVGDWLVGLLCWVVKLALGTLCLATAGALLGRPARDRLTDLLGVSIILALLAVVIVLSAGGSA